MVYIMITEYVQFKRNMVNSRAEFDAKKKNEAFRRIKFLHPLVAGRTRHAKEAWKEKKKQQVSASNGRPNLVEQSSRPNLSIGVRPDLLQASSTLAHHRTHTRKGTLRGLLYKNPTDSVTELQRPATYPDLRETNNKDFVIKNLSKTNPDWKRMKTKSCFPALHTSSTNTSFPSAKDESTNSNNIKDDVHTNGKDLSHELLDASLATPNYFNGWGQRRTMDSRNVSIEPFVRNLDPVLNYCRRKHFDLCEYEKRQLPNLWVHEHSLVHAKKEQSSAREDWKQPNKLDVKFIKTAPALS